MDTLIVRSLQGRATPQEEERILRWRLASEENDRKYREIARILALCRRLDATIPVSPPPSARVIIARAQERAREGEAAA